MKAWIQAIGEELREMRNASDPVKIFDIMNETDIDWSEVDDDEFTARVKRAVSEAI